MGFSYIDHFSCNNQKSTIEPNNLYELQTTLQNCHLCDLSKSRSQTMSGFGQEKADLMILDYTVSTIQDSTNDYYPGRSGEILKNMIEKVIGISLEQTYYTHAIKCKPLHSKKPSLSEWNSCKNHLYMQIRFIQPKVIMVLGEETYKILMDDESNFENVRGHSISFQNTTLVPLYHPLHLLRNPHLKKTTLSDLQVVKRYL